MPDLIIRILDVNPLTLNVVIMICVIAALLTREVVGGIYLAIASVPVYVASALICMYVARMNQLVATSDPAVEAIIASIVGITIVFLLTVIFLDLCRSFADWQVGRMVNKRKLANRVAQSTAVKPRR